MPKPPKNSSNHRLDGDELLARVKELSGLNKTEKAKACGYVMQTPDGKERAQLNKFMNALLEAQSIQSIGRLN